MSFFERFYFKLIRFVFILILAFASVTAIRGAGQIGGEVRYLGGNPVGGATLIFKTNLEGSSVYSYRMATTLTSFPVGHYLVDVECQEFITNYTQVFVILANGSLYSGLTVGGLGCFQVGNADVELTSLAQITDLQNAGSTCPIQSVGQPVNVTNGNVWLSHNDYRLSGAVGGIEVTRFYNSLVQSSGIFGFGWATNFDSRLSIFSPDLLQLGLGNGQMVNFIAGQNNAYPAVTPDFYGQILKHGDNTYVLTMKDGLQQKFSSAGKLLWEKDRNGNQTTLTYNLNGHLITITDPFGRQLNLSPSSNGNILQMTDGLGLVATYEYYPSTSLLKTVTYNDSSKFKFEYVTIGGQTLLATVKDALDNVVETHQYDAQGRATTSEKQGGVESYSLDYSQWDDFGYTQVTDALGRVTKYYFDKGKGRNVIIKKEGLCGCGGGGSEVMEYFYDARINLVRTVDALLNETIYTYDADSNLVTSEDVLGTQTFTHNAFGDILTATDRMGGVTTNTYSAAGNLLTTKDALNHTTTLTYTSLGQPQTVTDPLNHTTNLSYDSHGRPTQITDANGKNTNFGYDARARVTNTTNALSQTTSFEYDLNNRLKKVIYPDANFSTLAYDLAGRPVTASDPLNHSTTYAFDGAYRLTSVTDALNHATTFGYDLMSNMTSRTDALGNVTTFEYDDFDRVKKVVYPAPIPGATPLHETFTYDNLGKTKTRIDTGGRTTSYDYDSASRLIKITDPLSQLTQFEYNARSQMTKVKDALNQEYTFTYDPLSRLLTQTRNGTALTFTYDAVGNRATRTDYNGNASTYTHDVLNRLTNIVYTGSSEYATYGYDDLSRLVLAVNQNGTAALTYDNRGRKKTETDVYGQVVESVYDAASRRTAIKLNSNTHTSFAYDIADRLTTLTDESSANWTFGYDNADRLTSQSAPNGINTTYEYDGMSRLKRLKHVLGMTSIYDYQYTFNTANQISQVAELAGTKSYIYDNTDRLTAATGESYAYDAVGNRTASHLSPSYTIAPFNRVTASSEETYSYNANGSMTSKSLNIADITWSYGWDRENRLVAASDGATTSYHYDALGRRVKRIGSATEKYTFDGLDVLRDDVNGQIGTYQHAPGIDNQLKYTGNGRNAARYYIKDHLGSTIGTANSTGGGRDSVTYDSFGNPSSTAYPLRHQYTGRERDSTTGLYYYRARFYDPKLGRFISEDPIGFGGGDVNLYGYVKNTPTSFFDPLDSMSIR